MSDNKQSSGYSIRTDLLGMAIGILESKNNRLETNEHFEAENDQSYQRQAIRPYEPEDVLAVAEELYSFVQTKG